MLLQKVAMLALGIALGSCTDLGDDGRYSAPERGISLPAGEVDCSGIENKPEDCFAGSVFVQCPGPDQPRAWCGQIGGCAWISNGCPIGVRVIPLTADCQCTGEGCWGEAYPTMGSFFGAYGTHPWDRARAMGIAVQVDPSVAATGEPSVACTSCNAICRNGPCDEERTLSVYRQMPGTFVVNYSPGPFAGWRLELEVDPEARKARVCRIPFSDAVRCQAQDPPCASSGTLVLDQLPTAENFEQVRGTFSIAFDDGLQIDGVL